MSNCNKDSKDKTKWYSLNEEKSEEFYQEIESRKLENQSSYQDSDVDNLF